MPSVWTGAIVINGDQIDFNHFTQRGKKRINSRNNEKDPDSFSPKPYMKHLDFCPFETNQKDSQMLEITFFPSCSA